LGLVFPGALLKDFICHFYFTVNRHQQILPMLRAVGLSFGYSEIFCLIKQKLSPHHSPSFFLGSFTNTPNSTESGTVDTPLHCEIETIYSYPVALCFQLIINP